MAFGKIERKEKVMSMNPAVFLKNLERIVPGHGFKRVLHGVDLFSLRDSDGTILTGSTEPKRASLETVFEGVVSTAGQTDGGTLTFTIPRDYDQSVDKLRIRFLCQSAGTDVPTIDAAMYRKRPGVAISSDLDPTISAAINSATALAEWVEINCDSQDMRPGDAVHFDFTWSTHGSHDANTYGLEVEYWSDLAYYDKADRS